MNNNEGITCHKNGAISMVYYNRSMNSYCKKKLSGIYFIMLLCVVCFNAYCLTSREIASNAFPSVVVVIAEDSTGNDFAFGSGFFVSPGIVATNLHVVHGANKVRIRTIGSDAEHDVSGFTAVDYDNDLVLLKTSVTDVKPMNIGDDSESLVGDDVYAVGNPQGFEGTFSKGIISGKRNIRNRKIIQITAPISQGSSGGPVLSTDADVIGIAVSYIAESQNLNFAIPSSILLTLIKNQHEAMSVNIFSSKDTKKVSPSDLDNDKIPVAFGNVLLYLGMPEEEAKKKIERYYKVFTSVDNGDNCYIVDDGDNLHGATDGSFTCRNGKVINIGRCLGASSATNDMEKVFELLTTRLQELDSEGMNICVIDTKVRKGNLGGESVNSYAIELKFNNCLIHIALGGSKNDLSFYLYDEIK